VKPLFCEAVFRSAVECRKALPVDKLQHVTPGSPDIERLTRLTVFGLPTASQLVLGPFI